MRSIRVTVAAALLLASSGSMPARGTDPIVRVEATFAVVNANSTDQPTCVTDGDTYNAAGTITAHPEMLDGDGPRAITILFSGFDSSSRWGWALPGFPELDTPAKLADLGHTTLNLELLGYGASGRPHGYFSCFGSQAEVLHQVVQHLRAGSYDADIAVPFDRVGVVGHDVGGAIAQIEAYEFADVDALVTIIWANQGFTPWIIQIAAQRYAQCAGGGDELDLDGYTIFGPPDDEFADRLFHDADSEVVDTLLRLRERNPCGYIFPVLPSRQGSSARLAEIAVPVLLMFPVHDPVFTRDGQDQQAGHYRGTDADVVFLDAAHFPHFERNAADFRRILSEWLHENLTGP